jgi:hypothetical protein
VQELPTPRRFAALNSCLSRAAVPGGWACRVCDHLVVCDHVCVCYYYFHYYYYYYYYYYLTLFISFFKSSIARALPSVEAAAQERISKAVQEGRGVTTKDLRLYM